MISGIIRWVADWCYAGAMVTAVVTHCLLPDFLSGFTPLVSVYPKPRKAAVIADNFWTRMQMSVGVTSFWTSQLHLSPYKQWLCTGHHTITLDTSIDHFLMYITVLIICIISYRSGSCSSTSEASNPSCELKKLSCHSLVGDIFLISDDELKGAMIGAHIHLM